MHTHTYTHIHIHPHKHTYIHIYTHTYTYICIHHIHIYICICNHYFRFSSFIHFTLCFSLSIVMFSSNTSSYTSISYFKYNSFRFLHFPNKCSLTSCSFLHCGHRISCLYILLQAFFKINHSSAQFKNC